MSYPRITNSNFRAHKGIRAQIRVGNLIYKFN